MDSFSSDLRNTNMYSGASTTNKGDGVINAASILRSNPQIRNSAELSILDLKPGDSFKGQISGINGNEIELLLSNGELLEARIEGKIMLTVGQMLQFQVQSNEQNKIVLKPFLNSENMVGDAALKMAQLPINERTQKLVSSLLENGMSVDKNNLNFMNRASLNFPDADLKTLAMLSKMNIPLTKDNITQYENYKNFEYKLLDSMDDMISDIDNVLNSLSDNEKTNFIKEIITIFQDNGVSISPNDTLAVEQNLETKFQNDVPNQELEASAFEKNQVSENSGNTVVDNTVTNNVTINNTVINNVYIEKSDIEKVVIDNLLTKDLVTENPVIERIGIEKTNIENLNIEIKNLESADTNKVSAENEFIKASDNMKENLQKPFIKPDIAFDEDTSLDYILKYPNTAEKREGIKKHIRDLVSKNWMLEPKQVESKDNIQKLYEKVMRQSRQLQQSLEQYSKNTNIEPKSASNIQKNLQFMEQLDQVFSYVQLPLKFSEGKAHGDLYVMTNKKNLAKKDGTLSAFLHLDMINLGSTDIKITLQTEQNRLRCDFYLQEDSLALVAEHIDELNKALENKGYIIKTTVNPYEDDKPIIEKMEHEAGLNMTQMSYQSFDIRA